MGCMRWSRVLMFLVMLIGQDVCGNSVLIDTKGTSKDKDPFIATKEWQIVKEGQMVPPGLHVRFNLQTGRVEAKLLDKDANKDKEGIPMLVNKGQKVTAGVTPSSVLSGKKIENTVSSQTGSQLTREQIMEALKNVGDGDDVKDKKVIDEVKKKKLRSYDEIKKDFDKMNVKVKMDIEVIKELVAKLNSTNSTTEEKIASLTDLEYYLHQIDNAVDFMKLDGLNLLLHTMNDKELKLRSEATFAMGSAIQSNVKVQIRALELGLLENLKLKILLEKDASCLNRVLYSLSTLLRNFPYAQMKFVRSGGLDGMKMLFMDQQRGQTRLQVRMVTLLHDMVDERVAHEKFLNKSEAMQVEKLRQYKQVNIIFHLVKNGWCELIQTLLSLPDHDSREKVLVSLSTFHEFCPTSSGDKQRQLLERLDVMRTEYHKLADEEVKDGDKDGYFNSILQHVMKLQTQVKQSKKDEL